MTSLADGGFMTMWYSYWSGGSDSSDLSVQGRRYDAAGAARGLELLLNFNSSNWEMLLKVLDACDVNGRFWLLAAATTDVEYTLRVTDTESGVYREYFNPLGTAAPALVDIFETCP